MKIDYIGNIYEYIGTSAGRLIFQETGSVWHHVEFTPALFNKWCEEGVITVIEDGEVV